MPTDDQLLILILVRNLAIQGVDQVILPLTNPEPGLVTLHHDQILHVRDQYLHLRDPVLPSDRLQDHHQVAVLNPLRVREKIR